MESSNVIAAAYHHYTKIYLPRALVSYCFATSLYELILKYVIEVIKMFGHGK